jgi:O-antigen/teichoic acid export membrane protein
MLEQVDKAGHHHVLQRIYQTIALRRSDTKLFVNLLWSFLGAGLPLLVAIVTIPRLLHAMGMTRFGVLSLAWVVVGYFSLFDLGLGRAMTQLVARKIGKGEESDIPSIVWVGMILMTLLGVVGAVAVWLVSPWLVGSKLGISDDLRQETLTAFYLLAASIPVVIGTTGLRGVLEARQRFDVVNFVKITLWVLTYAAPLAVLPWSNALPALVASLVLARIVAFAAYLIACLRLYPELRTRPNFDARYVRDMLSFGGWMTVSNIVGPLLLYFGRLLLAVLVSVEAVAYFSTPNDVVTNLLIIPAALLNVFFPVFAQQWAAGSEAVRKTYHQALGYNLVLILPLTLLTVAFARPALAWWISPDFAGHSFQVAQLIAVGVLINSFAHFSQALIQAFGRPDLTAKLHVFELITYVPYLWWLIENYGITGAAVAWVVRATISTVLLWIIANRCLSGSIKRAARTEVYPEMRMEA